MRIRNELMGRGFRVELIDRKIGANFDIEKVIRTLENSDCILACLSSSYEYEKICQFEICYAHKIGKFVLPIAVQAKYKPDYWLEAIFPRNRVPECKLATMRRDIIYLERDIIQYAKIKPSQQQRQQQESNHNNISTASMMCNIL